MILYYTFVDILLHFVAVFTTIIYYLFVCFFTASNLARRAAARLPAVGAFAFGVGDKISVDDVDTVAPR